MYIYIAMERTQIYLDEAQTANALTVGRPGSLCEGLDDAHERELGGAVAAPRDRGPDGVARGRRVVDDTENRRHGCVISNSFYLR